MEDLNLEYDLRSTHTIPQGKILKIQTILQIFIVVNFYWFSHLSPPPPLTSFFFFHLSIITYHISNL